MDYDEDSRKCKVYAEFYEKNKKLFKKDSVEYWRQCRRYYQSVYMHEREMEKPVSEG